MAISVSTFVNNNGQKVATWVGDASAGTGDAVNFEGFTRLTVQRVSGTGTYTVEGSNDGVTFGALSTAIAAVADAAIKIIPDQPLQLRVITAAAAATVVIIGVSD